MGVAYLTDDLEFFTVFIVAGQKKSAIFTCPLPRPMETSHYHQIQSVPDTLQVVLLQLDRKSIRW